MRAPGTFQHRRRPRPRPPPPSTSSGDQRPLPLPPPQLSASCIGDVARRTSSQRFTFLTLMTCAIVVAATVSALLVQPATAQSSRTTTGATAARDELDKLTAPAEQWDASRPAMGQLQQQQQRHVAEFAEYSQEIVEPQTMPASQALRSMSSHVDQMPGDGYPTSADGAPAYPANGSNEWGSAEPAPTPRRRRRKRKRRPQQSQPAQPQYDSREQQTPNSELPSAPEAAIAPPSLAAVAPTARWRGQVSDDPDALRERDGIVLSIDSGASALPPTLVPAIVPPAPQPTESKEIVQGIVLRVGQREEPPLPPIRTTDKTYRRPYSAKRDGDSGERINTVGGGGGGSGGGGAAALKNLLKNSGGLSLSEILQQQNLSLDDLLKGKQNALQVLQSTTTVDPMMFGNASDGPSQTTKTPRRTQVQTTSSTTTTTTTTTTTPAAPVQRRLPIHKLSAKTPTTTSTTTTTEKMPAADETDIDTEAIHIVGTMASFLVPTTHETKPHTVRRIPNSGTERTKTIKEVVSSIRPDLHNSSTRKRLFPSKIRINQTATTTTSTLTTTSTTTVAPFRSIRPEYHNGNNKLPARYSSGYRLRSTSAAPAEDLTTIIPAMDIVEHDQDSKTSRTEKPPSTDITKGIIKSRLALRPRLRPFTVPPISGRSTTEPTPQETVETTMLIISAADNDDREDDLITTTLLPMPSDDDDEQSGVTQINVSRNSNNIHDILSQYDNQDINAIEQMPVLEETAAESGIHSMETIEELFQRSFGDATGERDLETITSRSDSIGDSDDDEENRTDATDNDGENAVVPRSRHRPSVTSVSSLSDVTERNPSLFADITSARTVDDRTDLLELLEDRRNGARLVKVLAQRNMTLAQLIAHRQRGSSQLHLAEIFLNKTQHEAEIAKEPASAPAMDVVTAFENFPAFNLGNVRSVKPDDIRTDSQGSSYFTSIIQIKPTDEAVKEGRALRGKSPASSQPANHRADMSGQASTSADFYQSWRDPPAIHKQPGNRIDAAGGAGEVATVTHRTIVLTAQMGGGGPRTATAKHDATADPIDVDSVYKGVEQIETNANHRHRSSQDSVDMELSGHGYRNRQQQPAVISAGVRATDRSFGGAGHQPGQPQQLPTGVRSAIVASASIVGVSLFIFIVIFAACRWRQRRKKTFNYAENFQAVRSRLPILAARQSARGSRSSSGGEEAGGSSKRSTSPPMVFHTMASGGGGGGGGGVGLHAVGLHAHGVGRMSARGSKINTMDPNSPEVQEYLYDAMRKPYQ